jgi:8-oxo-dGTP pyrophosphatase MutT (NUDIX family)
LKNKLSKYPLNFDDKYKDGLNNLNYSSVLVIVHFTQNIPTVLLTKRSSFLRHHAGEISFPGGRYSTQDKSFLDTAIRETFEEIGLMVDKRHVLGCLDPTYTYTSQILIYPFVALKDNIPNKIKPNCEVERIFNFSLDKLKESISEDRNNSTKDLTLFKFVIDECTIWGATARILKNLIDKLIFI